jgi:hypothetical protein
MFISCGMCLAQNFLLEWLSPVQMVITSTSNSCQSLSPATTRNDTNNSFSTQFVQFMREHKGLLEINNEQQLCCPQSDNPTHPSFSSLFFGNQKLRKCVLLPIYAHLQLHIHIYALSSPSYKSLMTTVLLSFFPRLTQNPSINPFYSARSLSLPQKPRH